MSPSPAIHKQTVNYYNQTKPIFGAMGMHVQKKHSLSEIRDAFINNGFDIEMIREFLEEQVSMNRSSNSMLKDQKVMPLSEYYDKERVYSKIEVIISTLK
jgi:hypothetical protein